MREPARRLAQGGRAVGHADAQLARAHEEAPARRGEPGQLGRSVFPGFSASGHEFSKRQQQAVEPRQGTVLPPSLVVSVAEQRQARRLWRDARRAFEVIRGKRKKKREALEVSFPSFDSKLLLIDLIAISCFDFTFSSSVTHP